LLIDFSTGDVIYPYSTAQYGPVSIACAKPRVGKKSDVLQAIPDAPPSDI
jgi:hypothetical protein